jgi:hypothetical protein
LQLEDYTVTMDQDFVGFFDFDYEQCYWSLIPPPTSGSLLLRHDLHL